MNLIENNIYLIKVPNEKSILGKYMFSVIDNYTTCTYRHIFTNVHTQKNISITLERRISKDISKLLKENFQQHFI
jgi:hypothetical protein